MSRIYHYQKDNGYRKQDNDQYYPSMDFHQKDDSEKNIGKNKATVKVQ